MNGTVYQRANGKWIASLEVGWTARGTRRRITRTRDTKRAARVALRDMEREIARSGVPAEGTRTGQTVKAWADKWLIEYQNHVRSSTWSNAKSALTKHIIPAIGHVRLASLSPDHIRAVHTAVIDSGATSTTASRAHSVLMRMLKDAAEETTVPESVFKVQKPPLNETTRQAIDVKDAFAILQTALQRPDAARWQLALLQAMRPAEVLGLTWAAVDFEAEQITVRWQLQSLRYKIPRDRDSGFVVPRGEKVRQLKGSIHLTPPKTGRGERVIPMVPMVKASLEQLRDAAQKSPHGLVFPGPGGEPRDPKDDREAWKELTTLAGVRHESEDDSRLYDLYEARHTTATLLRLAGADEETIIAIMGHSSMLSTRAYLHTDIERMRTALMGVAERMHLIEPAPDKSPAKP